MALAWSRCAHSPKCACIAGYWFYSFFFFGLALCLRQFYTRNISVQQFATRKMHKSKKISKMADAGNIEVPESSSSSQTTAWKFWPLGNRKWVYFYDENKWYLDGITRYFETFMWNWKTLLDICGKAYLCPFKKILHSSSLFCAEVLLSPCFLQLTIVLGFITTSK